MFKKLIQSIVNEMKPKARRGRTPTVRQCPYCQASFSLTNLHKHVAGCAKDSGARFPVVPGAKSDAPVLHLDAPILPALPTDLENQELSSDPLERVRQLEQREIDRILRES